MLPIHLLGLAQLQVGSVPSLVCLLRRLRTNPVPCPLRPETPLRSRELIQPLRHLSYQAKVRTEPPLPPLREFLPGAGPRLPRPLPQLQGRAARGHPSGIGTSELELARGPGPHRPQHRPPLALRRRPLLLAGRAHAVHVRLQPLLAADRARHRAPALLRHGPPPPGVGERAPRSKPAPPLHRRNHSPILRHGLQSEGAFPKASRRRFTPTGPAR